MFNLFYRNRQLLVLSLVLIMVWGGSAFFTLPRLEDPELTPRTATITTLWPGASPQRLESLVSEPLEQELQDLEAIETISSTSRTGISVIQVDLKDSITDPDRTWSRLRDTVRNVDLPPEASAPEVEIATIAANALIVGLVWDLPDPPNYGILSRLAETLAADLRRLPATRTVSRFSEAKAEIRVDLDPVALTQLGLTANELAQTLQASDARQAAGQIREPESTLLLELAAEFDSLERIRQTPLRIAANGQGTYLADVATVNRGIADPPETLALVDGRPAVVVAADVEAQARVDQWAITARSRLASFANQLPPGIRLVTLLDQSRYVQARLTSVLGNLGLGAVFVLGVTLVIMGWRSAMIVGLALPLACLMVFGAMGALGIPLHQISITGLIIALGLLIDNAIIMVDEVRNRLMAGVSAAVAVHQSVQHMTVPLLGSTLTTVLAFLPIALAPGSVGEFTGTIGTTVILALTSSLLLSLTIIPALVGYTQSGLGVPTGWTQGLRLPRLAPRYRHSLRATFRRPWLGIGLGLVLPLLGFATAPLLPQQFFPPAGRDQFYIEVRLPGQASLAATTAVAAAATEQLRQQPEVAQVSWFMGEAAPRFYYNVLGGQAQSANYAQALVQVRDSATASLLQRVQTMLDQSLPTAQVLVRQLEQGPPFEAPIELRLYGSDTAVLQQLGERVRQVLSETPHVLHTRANTVLPTLRLALDEVEVQRAGLSYVAIASQLQAYFEGRLAGAIIEDIEEMPVRVRLAERGRLALETLDLGTQLPLSSLGSLNLSQDVAVITRRQGQRLNTVQAYIPAGVLPSTVLSAFLQHWDARELPPGYRLELGGEADARGTSIANLLSTVGVLSVLMLATLVLSFNSFAAAGIILAIAIAAAGLGLGALYISGYPFGFTAILGTLGLVGLAINDSIVVLAALHELPPGSGLNDVVAVVEHSTRHIIATTLTTLVGFLPLLFDATGFWPPLAICIAGGLGGTTILALYAVPSAYRILFQLTIQSRHRDLDHAST